MTKVKVLLNKSGFFFWVLFFFVFFFCLSLGFFFLFFFSFPHFPCRTPTLFKSVALHSKFSRFPHVQNAGSRTFNGKTDHSTSKTASTGPFHRARNKLCKVRIQNLPDIKWWQDGGVFTHLP